MLCQLVFKQTFELLQTSYIHVDQTEAVRFRCWAARLQFVRRIPRHKKTSTGQGTQNTPESAGSPGFRAIAVNDLH